MTVAVPPPPRPLDYAVEQVWGDAIARGELDVRTGKPDPGAAREEYWVVPRATSAQYIIPRTRAAAAASLGQFARLRPPRTRMLRRVLATAAAAGIPLSRDTVSVYARPGARTVVEHLADVLGVPHLCAGLGVRVGANAKPTLELRTPEGDIVGYAKLGWNEATTRAVRNEARALEEFGPQATRVHVPTLLASGDIADRAYVVVAPLPAAVSRVAPSWSALSGAEALGPASVVDRRPLRQISQVRTVADRATDEVLPVDATRMLRRLIAAVVAESDPVPVAAYWHGDFVPWNLARDDSRRLWLFDWETAQADVPAGMDALHWFAHSQGPAAPARLPEAIDRAAERAVPALHSLGYSRRLAQVLSVWHAITLVDRASAAAQALGSWERVQLQPPVLRELLQRAAVRLDAHREGK